MFSSNTPGSRLDDPTNCTDIGEGVVLSGKGEKRRETDGYQCIVFI
jgi:hypothetical protein